jgi:AcrR family transcriptional regulator
VFSQNVKPPSAPRRRAPGRPPGPTAQGLETRDRLYRTAIERMASHGYEKTTMRDVAQAAGVSAGLLYRYFPSKRAVVLALYDDLSAAFVARAAAMSAGRWRDRYLFAIRTSLEVLGPWRSVLAALIPVLVGTGDDGLFAPRTSFSRERVQSVFQLAVAGATDAPKGDVRDALGRLLYLIHLGVLLWWLIDKSPSQGATAGLVALIERAAPLVALAMRIPAVRGVVRSGDLLFREALLGENAA